MPLIEKISKLFNRKRDIHPNRRRPGRISAEFALLILCSRTTIDWANKNKLLKLTSSGLDWAGLLEKAARQGVAQFLYYHLWECQEAWLSIPKNCQERLRQIYYGIAGQNWLMQKELTNITSFLNETQISVILLKGAGLLGTVYKNIALRPMVDVDLLVEEESLSKLKLLLSVAGYQKADRLNQESLEKFSKEVYFYKEGGLLLDIRATLSQGERFENIFRIDMSKEAQRKSKEYNNTGTTLRILDPNHLIMHLCLHQAVNHSFRGLFRFVDLREAILAYNAEIDWKELIIKAKYYKIRTILYYALYLTQELFGPVVKDEIIESLRPNRIQLALINFFIDKNKILSLPDENPGYKRYIAQVLMMDKFLDMLRLIFKSLFPSREWLIYKYSITDKSKVLSYRLRHPFIFLYQVIR